MGRRTKPAKPGKTPARRSKSASNARALEQRLASALEQQAATSEILRVISGSRGDAHPVFETIVRSAVRLCDGLFSAFYQFDGELLHLVAHHNFSSEALEAARGVFPARLRPTLPPARAILERAVIQRPDVDTREGLPLSRALGVRSDLFVPVLREGAPIGVIAVARANPGPFSDDEIELLKTFADQAVIAIENARLLSELQDKNEALTQAHAEVTEALDQQTATSQILSVIASSPADLQPVFDTIAASATRLCDALYSLVFRFDGKLITVAAHDSVPSEGLAVVQSAYPAAPGRTSLAAQAILQRRVIAIADTQSSTEYPHIAERARAIGYRSGVSVPMLRGDAAIGTINVIRAEAIPFSDAQIELLRAFADQAVIAIENVRLFTELQTSNRDLTTALDTQTATSDILRVISQSQTDVQPVFDAIVASAVRLLRAHTGTLTRIAGDQIELAALTSTDTAGDAALRARFPQPLPSAGSHAQTIRERGPINIADAQTDPRLPEAVHEYARVRGYRSQVAVPMLRHDEVIGTISVTRREPGGFRDDEIALLQTFADQAVIAIENARLLSELQDKNTALTQAHAEVTEALDQQTAMGEILAIISRSPTDIQPVFGAVLERSLALCNADHGSLYQLEGEALRHVAARGTVGGSTAVGELNAMDSSPGRAIRERRPIHLEDLLLELDWQAPEVAASIVRNGIRTVLAVPLLREQTAIGAILIRRIEVRPFTEKQIRLLRTFADQAVIAIENARLFTELQTSNRELTTALDTQTATSDILRVISRSQTDLQPVFDAIVVSAVRLLRAHTGALTRIAGDQIEIAALTSADDAGDAALRARFPQSLHSEDPHAQAIRARVPFNVANAQTDPRWPEAARAYARVRGYRSAVVVPMLRHHEMIGSIGVNRREPGGFTDDEIALLQTFADQAVIAIENARLLTELQTRTEELTRSVDELRALSEIGQAIGSTLDLQTVLSTVVARATQLADADAGVIYEYDESREVFEPRATERLEDEIVKALVSTPVRKGQGATGRLAEVLAPIQLADVRALSEQMPVRDVLIRAGYRALLAVPLVREDHLLGGLTVFRKTPGEYPATVVELLQTFATQSALAIQNARLFREIEQKSRELEVASQHKSEFLASMSHELRTPLNAVIGFSDVLLEGMFGETNEKQTEYLRDIHSSGQHLLSLINDILDLSKIEAGRMELDVTAFDLPTAIDDAMLLMRERAGRRGITLEKHVDDRLGEIRADQRKVKQVLLNLLSNAVKFTPEGGRIEVRAAVTNGAAEIAVTDTGIGIAPEDQEAVFEEFRQVGKAEKKAEGTGLGLALCRKFVELHGGRIWVKSQVDAGSTFTFTIPLPR